MRKWVEKEKWIEIIRDKENDERSCEERIKKYQEE